MRQIKLRSKPKENRLDKYLPKIGKPLTRSKAKKLIKEGAILVNDHFVDPDYELKRGDRIKIDIPPPATHQILPEKIPLKIVYEDAAILVVNKDAGMVVHPTADHPSGTLVNAILHYLKSVPEKGESPRPGIIHRLDKGTSGLMVIAKTQEALDSLKRQFKSRSVVKKYLALVSGKVQPSVGVIEKPIARHPKNRQKFAVLQGGRSSVTNYQVKETIGDSYSLVKLTPKTGRTHQIRVHLASISHPIVGDRLYGGRPASRIFLHSSSLEITHPTTNKRIKFVSNLPEELEKILQKTKIQRSTSRPRP
ncbi:MAG: hypothetical protein A2Z24_00075 [Candidatus Woykebacteria bacterium RBG_16_44_10]|uniref:Pseudouridine synthase n=1 Tax=Candidatus Woykebacteria bacterium RBG_16_44_10 TaxID=1802597 RepID=A0A1G1WFS0_9BACT|nr:MAG: hypothetical protein A2Z24_00075 [Candidatus Woykebacteria bacterium RBG_16_44_10]